jgi:hypothetical protein
MIDDIHLSDHFSLYKLTTTLNAGLQEENRNLTTDQIEKLRALAVHCEKIWHLCGDSPVNIHSGYRSDSLNKATHGSSSTSQHPRCEAVDFNVPGQALEDTFNSLLAEGRDKQFAFGQLILEEADRGYKNPDGTESISRWVHCSLIGTLDAKKIGQVMRMKVGPDGKPAYTLIEQLRF